MPYKLREHRLAYLRQWKKNNPEYEKLWRQNNPLWKAHMKAYSKKYRKVNRYRHRLQQREWCKKNPERRKIIDQKAAIKYNYGLTFEAYTKLREKQQDRCAICSREQKRLNIDHDHLTKQVRGLLCRKCNYGLGFFGDDTQLLEKAIAYLQAQ